MQKHVFLKWYDMKENIIVDDFWIISIDIIDTMN